MRHPSDPLEHPRRYEGRTRASCSFRIYGGPDFAGKPLAEGNHLMTEEVVEALLAEARRFGWQGTE